MKINETPFAAFVRHEIADRRAAGEQYAGLCRAHVALWIALERVGAGILRALLGRRLDALIFVPLFELAALCQLVAEDNGLIAPEFA